MDVTAPVLRTVDAQGVGARDERRVLHDEEVGRRDFDVVEVEVLDRRVFQVEADVQQRVASGPGVGDLRQVDAGDLGEHLERGVDRLLDVDVRRESGLGAAARQVETERTLLGAQVEVPGVGGGELRQQVRGAGEAGRRRDAHGFSTRRVLCSMRASSSARAMPRSGSWMPAARRSSVVVSTWSASPSVPGAKSKIVGSSTVSATVPSRGSAGCVQVRHSALASSSVNAR